MAGLAQNFFAGQSDARAAQDTQRQSQIQAMQMQRMQGINALAANPNATAEQFIRAGDAQTGNALAGVQQQQQADAERKRALMAQALPQSGALAVRVLTITDPAQRREAFLQAVNSNAPMFEALGTKHDDAIAKLNASSDADLDATLRKMATFAPQEKPIDVAAGGTLAVRDGAGGYRSAFTAPPKDSEEFGKINPSDYTRDSVLKFEQTKRHSDLVPIATPENDKTRFTNAAELRKEFNSQSATFRGVADSYQRIVDSAKDPSAVGDLSLIFNFMKVLDPGSTVHEGEFATAAQAGSVPSRIIAAYNKVLSGERLAPEQRADFLGRATSLYKGQEQRFKTNVVDRYTGLAKRYGFDPTEITVPLNADIPGGGQAAGGAARAAPQTNAQGWTLHVDKNGNRAYVSPDGKQFSPVQ